MRKHNILSLIALAACAGATDDSTTLNETPSLETPVHEGASAADTASSSHEYGETFEGEYVPHTYDELVSRFAQAFKAKLSDAEAAAREDGLRQTDRDSHLLVQGRVLVDEDAFLNVDAILGDVVRRVDKGRTLSGVIEHPVYGEDLMSTQYARMDPANPANFQFKRPYFGYNQVVKVVVPNTFVRDIMLAAVDKLETAADDCITSASIDVVLQSTWDGYGSQQQYYAPIMVTHGAPADVCPVSTEEVSGCAAFPRAYSIAIGPSLYQTRLVVGGYVGLNSAYVTGVDPDSIGTALHELLHTFGFGHTNTGTNDDAAYLTIPGTSGKRASKSIMRRLTASNYSNDLSADDKASIDTLYSAQPGSTCSTLLYETTCHQACVRVNDISVVGQCCWCNGALKHYAQSTWSGTTFICQ